MEEATTLVPETCLEHPATELPDSDSEIWALLQDDEALDEGSEPEPEQVEFPEWDAENADGPVAKKSRTK